ncbi:MAG: hypothetical protein ACKO1O_09565 [Erythrobacter sp.]
MKITAMAASMPVAVQRIRLARSTVSGWPPSVRGLRERVAMNEP